MSKDKHILFIIVFLYSNVFSQWNSTGNITAKSAIKHDDYKAEKINLSQDKYFGRAISYNDGYLAVGADDKVVIFKELNGNLVFNQKIQGIKGYTYYSFGHSVAINNKYLIVGNREFSSISIYKSEHGEWVSDTTITLQGSFGHIVSITNEFLFVGDPMYQNDGGGAVFVYKNVGSKWNEYQKILAKDRERFDRFGWSLDAEDNRLIIGAYQDTVNSRWMAGSAYIYYFDGTNWVEEQKIIASDGVEEDRFGMSVSISSNYIMVGAMTAFEDQSGAAYIFKYDGSKWYEQKKLPPLDPVSGGNFGWSVSIDSNYAISGAPFNEYENIETGTAYLFQNSNGNWQELQKFYPKNGKRFDQFGIVVLISDSIINDWVSLRYIYRKFIFI